MIKKENHDFDVDRFVETIQDVLNKLTESDTTLGKKSRVILPISQKLKIYNYVTEYFSTFSEKEQSEEKFVKFLMKKKLPSLKEEFYKRYNSAIN